MVSGWPSHPKKGLVIGGRGLRGSNFGVVWRRETSLVALETLIADDEISN
jgi:hypothetical protein